MGITEEAKEIRERNPDWSKEQCRALAALRKAEEGKAWERASAYVIIHPDGKAFGKIKVAHPADGMGPLQAFVWDTEGNGLQYGKASGCGYDKLAAALAGLTFDGIKLKEERPDQLIKHGYQVIQAL